MDKYKYINILFFYKIKYIRYSCENIYWKWKKKFIIWFYYIKIFYNFKIITSFYLYYFHILF